MRVLLSVFILAAVMVSFGEARPAANKAALTSKAIMEKLLAQLEDETDTQKKTGRAQDDNDDDDDSDDDKAELAQDDGEDQPKFFEEAEIEEDESEDGETDPAIEEDDGEEDGEARMMGTNIKEKEIAEEEMAMNAMNGMDDDDSGKKNKKSAAETEDNDDDDVTKSDDDDDDDEDPAQAAVNANEIAVIESDSAKDSDEEELTMNGMDGMDDEGDKKNEKSAAETEDNDEDDDADDDPAGVAVAAHEDGADKNEMAVAESDPAAEPNQDDQLELASQQRRRRRRKRRRGRRSMGHFDRLIRALTNLSRVEKTINGAFKQICRNIQ